MTRLDIFVSSTMDELREERAMLYELLPQIGQGTIQLRPWVFEHSVRSTDDKAIHKNYMDALRDSALYLGLFWNQYGEYTIEEFNQASAWDIPIQLYAKEVNTHLRDERLQAFLQQWGDIHKGISQKWFKTDDELRAAVKRSIQVWMRDFLKNRRAEQTAVLVSNIDDIEMPSESLVGKDAALTEVMQHLRDNETVLVQGYAGTGKTSFAITIVERWLTENVPILWYVIGSSDSDELYEGLLKGLGLPADQIATVMRSQDVERHRHIRHLIRERDVRLVVLDNAWNKQGLTGMLKVIPRDVPVLITARSKYIITRINHRVSFNVMTETDALTLLSNHAGKDYHNDEGAKLLCRYLAYHPFSIRIAGLNLGALDNQTSPGEYFQTIMPNIPERNVSLDRDDDSHLQREDVTVYDSDIVYWERGNVQHLLDASYNDLKPEEKLIFIACGAFFIPEVTLKLLALYLDSDETDIITGLMKLQVRGLVDQIAVEDGQPKRYRLHDMSFSYLKNRFTIMRNSETIETTALAACISYLETYQLNADHIDAEIDNLLGAAQWALDKGADTELLALMQHFAASGGYLETRGHTTRTRRLLQQTMDDASSLTTSNLLDQAFQRAHDGGNHSAAAILGAQIGMRHLRQNQIDDAETQFETVLEHSRTAGDVGISARALRMLAVVRMRKQPVDMRFREHLDESMQIAEQHNLRTTRMKIHEAWGFYYANYSDQNGDMDRAESEYAQAIALCRDLNDNDTLAFLLLSMGGLKMMREKVNQAEIFYREALLLAETLNKRPQLGLTNQGLWEVANDREQWEDAQRYLTTGLAHFAAGGLSFYLQRWVQEALGTRYYIPAAHVITALETIQQQVPAQLSNEEAVAIAADMTSKAQAYYESQGHTTDYQQLRSYVRAHNLA